MRKHLLLILALVATTCLYAQTTRVRSFEFEPRLGITMPLNNFNDGDKFIGPTLGMELRYNFKDSPFDIGMAIDIATAVYDFEFFDEVCFSLEQSNRTAVVSLTGDYNFLQGRKVNPFVGAGLGVAFHKVVHDEAYPLSESAKMAFTPRVGVELWRHLRFTLSAGFSSKGYNNLRLTVGYAFGGGKKKD